MIQNTLEQRGFWRGGVLGNMSARFGCGSLSTKSIAGVVSLGSFCLLGHATGVCTKRTLATTLLSCGKATKCQQKVCSSKSLEAPKIGTRKCSTKRGVHEPLHVEFVLNNWAIPPVRLGLSGRNSGKIPERSRKRSQSVSWNFPSRVRLGCPKPYNSRHLRLPERFQNSLPPSTAGDASFFRIGSGEGLSELVMEFPAVLGAFLNNGVFEP